MEGFPSEVSSLLSDAIERFEPTFAHYGLMAVFGLGSYVLDRDFAANDRKTTVRVTIQLSAIDFRIVLFLMPLSLRIPVTGVANRATKYSGSE